MTLILSRPRPAVAADHLYFIQSEYGGLIKIGRAQDVTARLATLQIGCPEPLHVVGIVPAGGRFEKQIHDHFKRLRVRGEWFDDAPNLLRFIERITS